MPALKALGGTSDILPEEAWFWQKLETVARDLFHLYGFQEIRTPILEESDLFRQSLGAQAEVVSKQMYEFSDRGKRQIALRPEGTAPIVRAFVEHGLDKTGGLTRWYYMGPMFRAERPQAGRKRQFHQMGVEVFGSSSPIQDAEAIELLRQLLSQVGLTGFQLKLNSLGCRNDRMKMVDLVKEKLAQVKKDLCPDCRWRLEHNPLRILDCKEPECASQRHRVDVAQTVCARCSAHFESVLKALEAGGLRRGSDYLLDPSLVRGLDYYTKTAFEVIHTDLGAQNALGGGGRYDDLVELLGGVSTPAVGFAVGVERILMLLSKKSGSPIVPTFHSVDLFVATIGEDSTREGFRLLGTLRSHGIASVSDYEGRPLRRQLEQANKLKCRWALILGDEERAKGVVTLRNMESGQQEEIPYESCVEFLKKFLKK